MMAQLLASLHIQFLIRAPRQDRILVADNRHVNLPARLQASGPPTGPEDRDRGRKEGRKAATCTRASSCCSSRSMSRSGTTTCSSGTNHLLLGASRCGVRLRSKPHFRFQIGSFGGEAVLRYVSLLLSTGEEAPLMSPEDGNSCTGAPILHCICT